MSLKKIAIGALGLSLIFLLGMGIAYLYAQERDFFFAEISKKLENETGYLIEKSGPVDLSLFPQPAIGLSTFSVSNPGFGPGATLFSSDRLVAQLDWRSLLRLSPVLDLEVRSADIVLEINPDGEANWMSPLASGQDEAGVFELERIRAKDLRVRFKNHQTQEVFGLDIDHIDSDIKGSEAMATVNSGGQYGAYRFLAQGTARYSGEAQLLDLDLDINVSSASTIRVAEVDIPDIKAWIEKNRSSFPMDGHIKGSLTFVEQLPHGQLVFEAAAENLASLPFLSENLDLLRPGLGPLAARGLLLFKGSDLDLKDLSAELKQEQAEMQVLGDVNNLLARLELDLSINARASSPGQILTSSFLSSMEGLPLSRLDSPIFNAELRSTEKGVVLENMNVDFSYQSLAGNVFGDFDFSGDTPVFNLELKGQAETPGDLLSLFDLEYELPPVLSGLNMYAKINSESSIHSIRDGVFDFQNGGLTGTVEGELNTSRNPLVFDLLTGLEIENLELFGASLPGHLLPFLEGVGVRANGIVSGIRGEYKLSSSSLEFVKDDSRLRLEGEISGLPTQAESEVDLHYSTLTPKSLKEYFPRLSNLQLTAPIDLKAKVHSVDSRFAIHDIKLIASGTDVEGDMNLDLGVSPVRVSAELSSHNFLAGLVVPEDESGSESDPDIPVERAAEAEEQAQVQTEAKPTAEELAEAFKAYTSSIAINTDWIKELDLYIGYKAKRALIGQYDVNNLNVVISARNGVFRLLEYEFVLDGRPLSVTGLIDSNPELPVYELEGLLLGDSLEALLKLDGDLLEGGDLQGDFKLDSYGNTLGGLIHNLDGEVTVRMGPLTIHSGILNTISTGIFKTMLGGILSKKEDQGASVYECGVLGIDVSRGIAMINKGLTLQAQDYNLAGNGSVDLNTGLIDLKVSPKARKGLGLSISTIVGGFKVQGNLATPDLGVSGGGLISAAVMGYALAPTVAAGALSNPVSATVVATGYLAKGFIDRLTANHYTCEKTLERVQRNRERQVTSSGASAPDREF